MRFLVLSKFLLGKLDEPNEMEDEEVHKERIKMTEGVKKHLTFPSSLEHKPNLGIMRAYLVIASLNEIREDFQSDWDTPKKIEKT